MNTSTTQTHITKLPGRLRDRIRLVKKFRGVQNTVAVKLGNTRSAVCHVVHKRAPSLAIEAALVSEINSRIDLRIADEVCLANAVENGNVARPGA